MATWPKHGFDKCGITDYTAMNLVPFLIMAHFTPDIFKTLKDKAKDLQYPLHVLNDNQAIIVENGKVKSIGGGDEIIL
jgi:peptidase E